jgi:hypothetical protein
VFYYSFLFFLRRNVFPVSGPNQRHENVKKDFMGPHFIVKFYARKIRS